MVLHSQLFTATVLYCFVFIGSIVEISTVIYAKGTANKECYLFIKKNTDEIPAWPCNLTLYSHLAATFYAMMMIIYHGYGTVVASRNNHVGRTMWVMPWLLMNTLVAIFMFISSCSYSIGYHLTCSQTGLYPKPLGCVIQGGAYSSVSTAELAGWICFLLWGGLIAVEVVRLRRNERALNREIYVDPNASDVVSIGNLEPTA